MHSTWWWRPRAESISKLWPVTLHWTTANEATEIDRWVHMLFSELRRVWECVCRLLTAISSYIHREVYWNHFIFKQKIASSNVNYIEKEEVELEGKKERTDIALVVFKFTLLDVWLMRIVKLGLEEDRGVLDSGSTKPYRGPKFRPTLFLSACWWQRTRLSGVVCGPVYQKGRCCSPWQSETQTFPQAAQKERKLSWNILYSYTDCCVWSSRDP